MVQTTSQIPDIYGVVEPLDTGDPNAITQNYNTHISGNRYYLRSWAEDIAFRGGRKTSLSTHMTLHYLLAATELGLEHETHGDALYADMQRAEYYQPMPCMRARTLQTDVESFHCTLNKFVKAHNLPYGEGRWPWEIGRIIGLGMRKAPLSVDQVMQRFRAISVMYHDR